MTQLGLEISTTEAPPARKPKARWLIWIAVLGLSVTAGALAKHQFQPSREWITIEVPNPPRPAAMVSQAASEMASVAGNPESPVSGL